mgnify:CR=1 FL=1
MRDPARIDEVLELLHEVWALEPDLRLGQLIYNAARIREPGLNDVFSIEDISLHRGLLCYREQILVDRSLKSTGG